MKHEIAHHLDAATAKAVAEHAFAEYQSRYPKYEPTLHWVDDRHADIGFHAKGVRVHGAMEILDRAIVLNLDVPFLFRPFQKLAVEVIDREVKRWLDKASAGQL